MDPVENWAARGESIPKYLDEIATTKSKKRYSAPCWPVIYLNINDWGLYLATCSDCITVSSSAGPGWGQA
jgi:hypothetical protein